MLVHTIQISETNNHRNGTVSATRKSQTRRYEACIVATAGDTAVKNAQQRFAQLKAKLKAAKAALAKIQTEKMTLVDAKAQFAAEDNAK